MSATRQALRAPVAFDGIRFLVEGATVLVEDDRIVGVEPFVAPVPEGFETTTFSGTLLPGLIDTHVHLVGDGSAGGLERCGIATDDELDGTIEHSLAIQARAGVTTVRDLGDRNYRTLAARDRRSPVTPRIVCAGPPVTMPDGHCHFLGGGVTGVDGVREAVAEHVERGVDVIKVMASGGMLTAGTDMFGTLFSPDEMRALVDAAHDEGLPVVAHAHSLRGIEHAMAAGVDGVEHFSGLVETGVDVPDRVLAQAASTGLMVGPTAGFDMSVMAAAPPPPPGALEAMRRTGMDFAAFGRARTALIGRMRDHGVRVVTGLDAGAGPPKPHGGLVLSIEELVAAGYPMAEALATATSIAADACGLGQETGALRAGLAADLLTVDGDLRAGPDALRRPRTVLVRGVPVA